MIKKKCINCGKEFLASKKSENVCPECLEEIAEGLLGFCEKGDKND
ncbi:MAG: hypothetical protein ACOCT9_01620 [archaeon]